MLNNNTQKSNLNKKKKDRKTKEKQAIFNTSKKDDCLIFDTINNVWIVKYVVDGKLVKIGEAKKERVALRILRERKIKEMNKLKYN